MTEGAAVVLRTTAGRLARGPADAVPAWVSQAVLNSQWTPKEALKLSFYLAPHASDDLPASRQALLDGAEQLLTAPRPNAVRACAPLPWLHFARAASTCRARCRRLSGG